MRDVSNQIPGDPKTFDELSIERQEHVLNWIAANLIQIKSFNYLHSSYGLKHMYQSVFSPEDRYLTNGEFRGAMLKAGFKKSVAADGKWYFNLSNRSPGLSRPKP